ncbi:integrase catalytic domain-containing protein [Trichonephila clavipes]|nr:integrase catalytic domain-containing protein [Trichonephila clavipes]
MFTLRRPCIKIPFGPFFRYGSPVSGTEVTYVGAPVAWELRIIDTADTAIEVKNDEIVELARNNFSAPVNQKKIQVNKPDKFPSAATLVSTHDRNGTGRYELCLPFKSEAIDLSSNKYLTWKRHKKMCERAQRNGILDNYKVIFKEWEELEIIEKIEEKGENSYFLPHRPIVKDDNITTKIRPVFDASARVTGQSSLNDLLYKGPNLIEQIPDILDRFRRYPIGLSADIEKAFLQLGITPKHRDFLKFFYPDEGEDIVYRHCRVVFGVSLSPFLLAAVLAHLLENVQTDDTQLGSKLKLSFYVDNCLPYRGE